MTVFGTLTAGAVAGIAQTTPPCNDQNAQTVPVVYPPGTGDPCAAEWTVGGPYATPQWQPPFQELEYGFFASACWRGTRESLSAVCQLQGGDPPATPAPWGNPWDSWGFFLNVDPIGQPSIGDFLPPSPTIDGTSVCLVPDAAASSPTGWQGLSRPTVDRVVDLVTGLPLIQVQDLSLPVDGAAFRLIRTRSQDNNLSTLPCVQPDRWWDWAGEGWMVSENPLLLIDSAVPETVGNQPRTTYLLLDAHHSIPFQLIEATGLYEAPARFRARLAHNGVWDRVLRRWSTPPSRYHVSLYDGELRYTFVAVREDAPKNRWSSAPGLGLCPSSPEAWCESTLHDRPFLLQQLVAAGINLPNWRTWDPTVNPGVGMPYYGLCTLIEDRYGHKVEIDYCAFTQRKMDDLSTSCVECSQNCPGKGQIRSIKVSSAAGVQWTLMYAYRIAPRFPSPGLPWDVPDAADRYGRRIIDSIYVYEGDRSVDVAAANLCEAFSSNVWQSPPVGRPNVDAVDGGPQVTLGVLGDWKHRVRYHYSFNDAEAGGMLEGPLASVPLLIKTTVEARSTPQSPVTRRQTVFKYSGAGESAWLEAVFSPEDVDRALVLARQPGQGGSWITSNHLALWADSNASIGALSGNLAESMLGCASVRLDNHGVNDWSGTATPEGPDWLALTTATQNGSQYIKQPAATLTRGYRFGQAPSGEVRLASLRGQDGNTRHYRMFRFAVDPEGSGGQLAELLRCQPSAVHAPYAWNGFARDFDDVPLTEPPADYTQARWITVIDEFASRAALTNGTISYGSGSPQAAQYGTKQGQLSRRVVEVSPSGVTLRDRLWQFADSGVLTSGTGLGEEFVFERASVLLDLPPLVPSQYEPGSPVNEFTQEDPLGHLRREVVLVEHRSVGWSAAYLADLGNIPPDPNRPDWEYGRQDGFVRFYEYEPFMYDGDLSRSGQDADENNDGWDDDLVVSLELKAEGIKRGRAFLGRCDNTGQLVSNGSGGPRLYTRRVFRPTSPDTASEYELESDVQFINPVESANITQPLPGNASSDLAVTHALTYRRHTGNEAVPVPQRPIRSKVVIGAPRRQRPGNSEWYFPVEREWYSEGGAMEWAASGLVLDPLQPAPGTTPNEPELQSLTFTRYLRDWLDRPVHTILDAQQAGNIRVHAEAPALDANDIGSPPDGWARIPAAGALNYVTSFRYDNPGNALSDAYFPNGRRWASRILVIGKEEHIGGDPSAPLVWNQSPLPPNYSYSGLPDLDVNDYYAREYIFNDVERRADPNSPGTSHPYSRMLGEIRDYAGREPVGGAVRVRRVYFAVDPGGPAGAVPVALPESLSITAESQPRFVEEARVQLSVDSNGRPSRAELLEADPNGAMLSVGTKEVNDLVDVRREREIDGTITRVTRNKLGQPLRTYAGTLDDGWSNPQLLSNLVLLNRTEYGTSIQNAWMPTVTRQYTYQPSWADDHYGTAPPSDSDGFATITQYDWRMRPVRVDVFGEDGASGSRDPAYAPRLSSTLTILDHLDRPIIQATFGAGDLSLQYDQDLDPPTRTAVNERDDPRPNAARYLGLDLKPISLTETFYGPDGSVNEVRTYDVSSTASEPRWHSEYTYSGRNGVQVYAQRPQQPVSKGEVDGLGRLAKQRSLALRNGNWGYEIGRTDYTIDADGNVVDTARFERALFDEEPALAATGIPNAVRSRTVAWFDPKKRMTASAELGTERPEGFVAGPTQYVRPLNDANASEPFLAFDPLNPAAAPDFVDPNAIRWGIAPLLSVNHYDLATGRLTHTRQPDGSITEVLYDRAGRTASKIENRFGSAALRRTTSYKYQYGRLVEIRAARTTANVVGKDQVTRVTYGADIVAEVRDGESRLYTVVSRRNDLVGKMSLPNENDGNATSNNDILLRYTFGGQVAERIDARGAAIRYFYDALGRLTEIVIGRYDDSVFTEFSEKHPDTMTPASGAPVDRIGYVVHTYDAGGRPADVIAYVSRGGEVVAHNRFIYDSRGNLAGELQMHGQVITPQNQATVPTVNYEWNYEETDLNVAGQIGHERLASMTYPAHEGLPRRIVSFGYGDTDSTDDILSRLAKLSSRLSNQSSGFAIDVARFQYFGVSRRRSVAIGHGNGAVTADFHLNTELGLGGLDRFGRIANLHYKSVGGATMFQGRYAYDAAGNRTWAEITQAPVGGQTQLNTRSQLNQYNQLNQLIGTQVGHVNTTGTPSVTDMIRADTWSLDLLGNWSGPAGTNSAGRFASGNLDGGYGFELGGYDTGATLTPWTHPDGSNSADDIRAVSHTVNGQNEITNVRTHTGNPMQGVDTEVRHDAAGNLIFDGTYFYQYDTWNRLIQINRAHLEPGVENFGGDPPSTPVPLGIVADELIKHYTYDGLGRLIRTQSPYPSPDNNQGLRTERFYYDGVRRIQELVADPVEALAMATSSSNSQVQTAATSSQSSQAAAAEGELDESATPLTVEQTQLSGDPVAMPIPAARLEREYIWGPGDGAAGVDELFVQYDVNRKPWWVVQDAGGDIVALCDNAGTVTGAPFVAAQWTYDAYGSVLSADHLSAHPFMHAGHKGLFFDRLDVGVADQAVPGAGAQETPRLVPFAHAIVHNRGRAYNPQFGRFMQPDPNAAALAMLEGASYNGRGFAALAVAFDLSQRYGDGSNLYEYLGSNPWNRSDPMGLSWDPFDMVDELIAEHAASGSALLAAVGNGAKAAAVLAAHIATYLPFPAASLAGELALVALGEQDMQTALIAAGMGLIPAGKLLGPAFKAVGKFIGRAASAAWNAAKHYAGKAGKYLARMHPAGFLIERAWRWLAKGCGCFEEGTQVQTARGMVPIDQLCEGDEVFAQDEATGQVSLRKVVRTFVRKAAPIVAVTLIGTASPAVADDGAIGDGAPGPVTLNTTEEHPFLVEVDGEQAAPGRWVQAASLKPGDEVFTAGGEPAVVVSVQFTGRRATVYNIEVEGLHNYRVGREGFVVHNNLCNLWQWGTNMADHVLQPKHNWDQVFGGKPSWNQVKELLGKAANEGVEGMPQAIYNSAGKQIGVQLEKVIVVNGREVVAKLSRMDALEKWILKDGWVR